MFASSQSHSSSSSSPASFPASSCASFTGISPLRFTTGVASFCMASSCRRSSNPSLLPAIFINENRALNKDTLGVSDVAVRIFFVELLHKCAQLQGWVNEAGVVVQFLWCLVSVCLPLQFGALNLVACTIV